MQSSNIAAFRYANAYQGITDEDEISWPIDMYKAVVLDRNAHAEKPWTANPKYFQTCYINTLTIFKMLNHAVSGGDIEVMGMVIGKAVGTSVYILDSYALPVEGTETRVNAQAESYEYMVQYLSSLHGQNFNKEMICGWYHSHPDYGCWLSGIDVATQALNQGFQDPYIAVVIDPKRSLATGKLDIGCFRTLPEGYSHNSSSNLNLPKDKLDDFGVHSHRYYALKVEILSSELDDLTISSLWSNYWVEKLTDVGPDTRVESISGIICSLKKSSVYEETHLKALLEETDQDQFKVALELLQMRNALSANVHKNYQLLQFQRSLFMQTPLN